MSEAKAEKIDIYGWEGICLSTDNLSITMAPQIGGRIMSLKYQGQELLFAQDEYKGDVYSLNDISDLRAEKKKMGFRLWGGDKTWVAPQKAWWEKIPPLDLDAGQYHFEVKGNVVMMTSPCCRETGLKIIREVQLNEDESINLKQTFKNETDQTIEHGIWDVTQVLRPFDVYLPAARNQIRAYKDEGLVEDAESKVSQEDEWIKINCDDQTQFKLGGMVNQGVIVALRHEENSTLVFKRTFTIDAKAIYAHDAMAEVYNSPNFNYLEIEAHAPLVILEPGDEISHHQNWTVQRLVGHITIHET